MYENVSLWKLPVHGGRFCQMQMWKRRNQDSLRKRGPLFEQVFKLTSMWTQMWNPMPQGKLRVGSQKHSMQKIMREAKTGLRSLLWSALPPIQEMR